MERRARVLIVDDSAFARKVLREALELDPALEVVGTARDGLDALEKISTLRPDVVTLDLVMPNLDGLGVLQALPVGGSPPPVVVVSIADDESELGLRALEAGAADLVHKPTAQATARLYELADDLRAKVRGAAGARPPEPLPPASAATVVHGPVPRGARRALVAIGASTGGPQAVTRILRALPASFPVPIAVVLHMPLGYTAAFAHRLDEDCALHVVEAADGGLLEPGLVVVGRAGSHLRIEHDGALRARLSVEPLTTPHRPSVDVLFESVAALGPGALGVVLTGMGNDGELGARRIVAAGGTVLTEAESSCVVYGMPRAVDEAGMSTAHARADDMAALIWRHL